MSDTRGYKYKYPTAAAELGTGFGVTGAYPLDGRLSVASLLDFYDSSAITIYQDMFFVADDTKKFYIVTDKPENAVKGSDCTVKEVGNYEASDFDIKDLTDSTGLKQTWSGKQDALTPGDNITIENNTISATGYTLPTASDSTLGGIKVGEGLHMESDALSAATSSDINPVNKDEITFNSFRNTLIEDGKVKDGLTFEKFIKALFCKRNDEKVLQDILNKLGKKVDLPSVTISGSADNTDPVFIEACTNMGTLYDINRTVSYSYSPGKIYYWKFTNGESTDEILNFTDTGCSINNNKWSDNSTGATVTQNATYTIQTTADGSEATLIDTSISVNSIYYKFGYNASTKETPDASTGKSLVTTSYGNNLYAASTKAISAESNETSNTLPVETRSIKTYFYYGFSRKNTNNTYDNTTIKGPGLITKKEIKWGDEYYFPEGSTVKITYTTGGAEATLSPENDELISGYMSLPCEGKLAAKFSSTAPTNAPYKKYKKWVISENQRHPQVLDPAIVNTVKITFS